MHDRCVIHATQFVRQRVITAFNEMYMPGLLAATVDNNAWRVVVDGWRMRIGEPFIDRVLVQHLELNLAHDLGIAELWNLHMGDVQPMDQLPRFAQAAPPRGELEAFVRDNQNVHTRVIAQQTNSSLDLLLGTTVPVTQRTVLETHLAFLDNIVSGDIKTSLDKIDDVDRDVKRWYRTQTCRTENDYLYKRALDGLWAKIKASPLRKELEIRLWQEMLDSVHMCCEGHISRLANVLCGFDEAFVSELTPAEKLQNRMAVIAGMDADIILQTAEAVAALKEASVPNDQWEAWIDAL